MVLEPGSDISYRLLPEMARHGGRVISTDGENVVVESADAPPSATAGGFLVISGAESNLDYYAEIIEKTGDRLRLRLKWTGKRAYFRVDDSLPLVYRKIDPRIGAAKARTFAGYEASEPPPPDEAGEPVSPRLWRLLCDINARLGLILERLNVADRRFEKSDVRPVNISASGIRFTAAEPFEIGDLVEVTMLLPLSPAVGVTVSGSVVRVKPLTNGECEVALYFIHMDDVLDVIIQYTLKRQREMIREQKLRSERE